MNINKLKFEHLNKLYYTVGKQATDILLQIQKQRDDEYTFSKRVSFINLNDKSDGFALLMNNRTLLKNEIVADLDPQDFGYDEKKYFKAAKSAMKRLPNSSLWFSGSRGLHIHGYDDDMFYMSNHQRYKIRSGLLKGVGADMQLVSDNVTITLEYANNAKTNSPKIPVELNDLTREVIVSTWSNN